MTQTKNKIQKITYTKGQFAVNPPYVADRTGNYERRDKIKEKWENFTGKSVDGSGNVNSQFFFDVSKQEFIFSKASLYLDDNFIPMYRLMSPALLLYRLIATFFAAPVCYDNYKMIWEYNIGHKATGKPIQFSEWKGAIGFWVPEYDNEKLDTQFKNDLIELMTYIISNECVHPYDNLVAGSVA